MKFTGKIAAFAAMLTAVCLMMTACSSQRENTGVAYEKNMTIESAADLEGKAVAVQLLSPADDFVVSHQLTEYPRRYENLENAVQDLIDKKVAVVIADSHYAKQLVDGKEGVRIVDGAIGSVTYHFRFAEADAAFAEAINERISTFTQSGDYQTIISEVLENGREYAVPTDQESKGTAILVAQTGLKPFFYQEDGEVKGFEKAVAAYLVQAYGMELTCQAVYADAVTSTVAQSDPAEHCFCVVANPGEIEDGFVTTNPFYTSELVMIIRDDAKK